jgi:hypothetical protein
MAFGSERAGKCSSPELGQIINLHDRAGARESFAIEVPLATILTMVEVDRADRGEMR